MRYIIPGQKSLEINTLILDLNGTLSVGGKIPKSVKGKLDEIKEIGIAAILLTGNTRGDADKLAGDLEINCRIAKTAEDKLNVARELGLRTCASVGNGLIDEKLTRAVELGIVTLQAEGAHIRTLLAAKIVVPTIEDALDLFIDPDRLIATLRS